MTNPDTPDYQRGVVAAQTLIASFDGTVNPVTVDLTPDIELLWILPAGSIDPTPLVQGVTTLKHYPAYPIQSTDYAGNDHFNYVVAVSAAADAQVTIMWPNLPGGPWFVLGDNGSRFTVDANLSAAVTDTGTVTPPRALLVAGSDGTDLRALLTDSSGRLQTSGATFPPVYGPPAVPPPADVLQVGGTDGTDLRALLVDLAGRLHTVDLNLQMVVAFLNTAAPTQALLVGGSDGVDLRAVATTSGGHVITEDNFLKSTVGTSGSGAPVDTLQAGGTDGTDLRTLRTDQGGRQYAIPVPPSNLAGDHPGVELALFAVSAAVPLAAPGAGKRYRLFVIEPVLGAAGNAGFVSLTPANGGGAGAYFGFGGATAQYKREGITFPLSGLPLATNTALTWTDSVGTSGVSVVYTTETV